MFRWKKQAQGAPEAEGACRDQARPLAEVLASPGCQLLPTQTCNSSLMLSRHFMASHLDVPYTIIEEKVNSSQ